MKNRKVLNLRCHLGGLHGKTSFDADQDRAEMELSAVGVVIKKINNEILLRKGKPFELLIPYSNCVEVVIEPEQEEIRRSPGRPPKVETNITM